MSLQVGPPTFSRSCMVAILSLLPVTATNMPLSCVLTVGKAKAVKSRLVTLNCGIQSPSVSAETKSADKKRNTAQ